MNWAEKLFVEAVWSHTIKAIQMDEKKTMVLKLGAIEAFYAVRQMVLSYAESQILFWLTLRILYKKGEMIEHPDRKHRPLSATYTSR